MFTENPNPADPTFDMLEILFTQSNILQDIAAETTLVFSVD